MNFEQLGLIEPINRALKTEGYTQPTPIQQQAIPVVLKGKDLLGVAQTGTGKTAAFAIPVLQKLSADNRTGFKHVRALVLTPTRELAIQIQESFEAYGRFLDQKVTVIFGGVPQHSQVNALRYGTDILVATPGRLLDLMNQGEVNLDHLEIFILDEADRMLDMGFINDVRKVIRQLPEQRQTLLFSATMPNEIVKLAGGLLYQPERVEVAPVSSTAETVEQLVFMVDKKDKQALLQYLLQDLKISRTLVFARTKHGADRLAKNLKKEGIKAEAIHGDKAQNARQRALVNFKDEKLQVLVATDIAARGIDVDNLAFVFNYDLPNVPETYVHRIGRTGRAGANGIAFSFCDREERAYLKDIVKLIARPIPVAEAHPYKMEFKPVENSRPSGGGQGAARQKKRYRPKFRQGPKTA